MHWVSGNEGLLMSKISARIESLRKKHRELDVQIQGIEHIPGAGSFKVQSLKRKKLKLKQEITNLEKSNV